MTINYSSQADYIKALMADYSWTGTSGTSYDVSYSFDLPSGADDLDTNDDVSDKAVLSDDPGNNLQAQAAAILQLWSNVAEIEFTETNVDTELWIAQGSFSATSEQGLGFQLHDDQDLEKSNVYMKDSFASYVPGSAGAYWLLHEIGHAIGLKHPNEANADNSNTISNSTLNNAVMKAGLPIVPPETPMLFDIAAAQFLYGANFSYHSGNNTYSYDGSSKLETIWDGGGTADTLSTTFNDGALLDLRSGFGDNGQFVSNIDDAHIFIAFHADIENAIGGDGNDTINGNDSVAAETIGSVEYAAFSGNNSLDGGKGDDIIYGYSGDDTIIGGENNGEFVVTGYAWGEAYPEHHGSEQGHISGGDTLVGGAGTDTYIFTSTEESAPSDPPPFDWSELGGFYTVIDADGNGLIKIDNFEMTGTAIADLNGDDPGWNLEVEDEEENVYGALLRINEEGDLEFRRSVRVEAHENSEETVLIVVKDFNNGDLGITLEGFSSEGSEEDDTLQGGAGSDTMTGGDGNDVLYGKKGSDSISGDAGNDTIEGGKGGDTLAGGSGINTLSYNSSSAGVNVSLLDNTYSSGDAAGDNVSGFQNLIGSANNDTMAGDNSDNSIDGGAGDDLLYAKAGNDTVNAGNGNDAITGLGGTDSLSGGDGSDTIQGGDDNDVLNGNDGNDVLNGDNGTDSVYGGAGNDTIYASSGGDSLYGGTGDDLYSSFGGSCTVIENSSEGNDTIESGGSLTLFANVENLILSGSSNVDGTGNALDNQITGNTGNNTLYGNDGNDTLSAGNGADTLYGQNGTDVVNGEGGNDTIYSSSGNDTLAGGTGDDYYYYDNSTNTISENSSEGNDTVSTSSLSVTLGSNVENLVITGSSNLNGTGNTLANQITGNSGNNTLSGSDGNDTIIGGAGTDSLSGGNDNDTLMGGTGGDTIDGGSGNDTASYANATSGVYVDILNSVYTNGEAASDSLTSIENLIGSNYDDVLAGGNDDNLIYGGTGNDLLYGKGGNDTVYGGDGDDNSTGLTGNDNLNGEDGNDTLQGGDDADTLSGGNGADAVNGDNGNDIVYGDAGNDTLNGKANDDTIYGGSGTDNLYGESGADYFVLQANGDSGTGTGNRDIIVDFVRSQGDKIDLSAFSGTFTFLGTGSFTSTAHEIRYTQSGSDTIIDVDSDGNGAADFQIQMTGLFTLVSGDFVL